MTVVIYVKCYDNKCNQYFGTHSVGTSCITDVNLCCVWVGGSLCAINHVEHIQIVAGRLGGFRDQGNVTPDDFCSFMTENILFCSKQSEIF